LQHLSSDFAEVKQSQRVTLRNVFKTFSYKETCKNERVTVLRHFYTVSFKLSVKNKTGKSQKVRDKTYKVVNLISKCASIISIDISMDLSMDIHIHGKPAGRPCDVLWGRRYSDIDAENITSQ